MAGYSGTPLPKKLGFKEGFRVGFVNPPKGFRKELGPLPDGVTIFSERLPKSLNLILFFVDSQKQLKRDFSSLAQKLVSNGMLWISWPKKSSGAKSDTTEEHDSRRGAADGTGGYQGMRSG